ncbi:hypothetical protein THRCLA_11286 [Thraustotheca clavata]|uniref:Uncharacterized protein n=1 Tax=Thraustotheca clavata TaxID=74557 RepID=A0A1V9Y869_9STRA|nr:hypothetical protein THRCLA_11286 [Thraustotheca clavata]
MAGYLPDASTLFELHERIVTKKLDDSPMFGEDHPLAWQSSSEVADKYKRWRMCDEYLSKYKEIARLGQNHKLQEDAYIKAVMCTGRALAPTITAQWVHCAKRQGLQHGQCSLLKRMMERSLRVEAQDILRKLDSKF